MTITQNFKILEFLKIKKFYIRYLFFSIISSFLFYSFYNLFYNSFYNSHASKLFIIFKLPLYQSLKRLIIKNISINFCLNKKSL